MTENTLSPEERAKSLTSSPRPWEILWVGHRIEVMDAERNSLFVGHEDNLDFWSFVVESVNGHSSLLTALEEAEGHIQQIADEVGESDDPGAAWEAVHAIVQENKALTAQVAELKAAIGANAETEHEGVVRYAMAVADEAKRSDAYFEIINEVQGICNRNSGEMGAAAVSALLTRKVW